jgi:hypothetical protein
MQLLGSASAPSRKCLHDLTAAWHFERFEICTIRILTMQIETFPLRGKNSIGTGTFQLSAT